MGLCEAGGGAARIAGAAFHWLMWVAAASSVAAEPDAIAAEGARADDGLSALHVRYRMPGEHELSRATIELSPSGLRVRQTAQGAGAWEMIESFVDGGTWLVDRDRGVALELAAPGEMAALPDGPTEGEAPSFLGRESCGGALVPPPKQGRWRNRPVRVYECASADEGGGSVEFVDVEFGVVSYRRDASGRVDELRDLRARRFDADVFRPGSGLRSVDPDEFFDGAPAIGSYIER